MAGTPRYTAVLDANVLYPDLLRDLLMSLAMADLYSAKWSEHIHQEWMRNLKANRPGIEDKVDALRALMDQSLPDALVQNYESLIDAFELPDPDDRHVLAAAIVGHADAIVTANLKDFPKETLAAHQIEVVHPDDFIMNQLELAPREALPTMKLVRARMKKPTRTAMDLIAMIEKSGLPQTAQYLQGWSNLI